MIYLFVNTQNQYKIQLLCHNNNKICNVYGANKFKLTSNVLLKFIYLKQLYLNFNTSITNIPCKYLTNLAIRCSMLIFYK